MLILLAMPWSEESKRCREALERPGHTVERAFRGALALKKTLETEFDFLVTAEDFGRDDRMDGPDLLGFIRDREKRNRTPRLPVVMMSRDTKRKDLVNLVRNGELDLLVEAPLLEIDPEIVSRLASEPKR